MEPRLRSAGSAVRCVLAHGCRVIAVTKRSQASRSPPQYDLRLGATRASGPSHSRNLPHFGIASARGKPLHNVRRQTTAQMKIAAPPLRGLGAASGLFLPHLKGHRGTGNLTTSEPGRLFHALPTRVCRDVALRSPGWRGRASPMYPTAHVERVLGLGISAATCRGFARWMTFVELLIIGR
jgi:hypothetical protein